MSEDLFCNLINSAPATGADIEETLDFLTVDEAALARMTRMMTMHDPDNDFGRIEHEGLDFKEGADE